MINRTGTYDWLGTYDWADNTKIGTQSITNPVQMAVQISKSKHLLGTLDWHSGLGGHDGV